MGVHCCDRMRANVENVCADHPDRFDCADALLSYIPKFDEYGIIVHDGGSAVVGIVFCPWCGARLPPSKRDRWFDELARQAIDPTGDDVPPEYETDEWYRGR